MLPTILLYHIAQSSPNTFCNMCVKRYKRDIVPLWYKTGMSNSMYLEGHMGHVHVTMRAACTHYHERCTQNIIKTITSIIKYCYRNIGHIIAMLCSIHKHKIMKSFYKNKMKYFFKHFFLMFGMSFC